MRPDRSIFLSCCRIRTRSAPATPASSAGSTGTIHGSPGSGCCQSAQTWDGYLNDINGGHVRAEHVEAALDAATGGPVAEGSVGGGTEMTCYEFKGGNGTASRQVSYGQRTFTVGVFVQANFGSRIELTVAGRRVGPELLDDNPLANDWFEVDLGLKPPPGAGSVIAIVATDAPLLPGQCKALARRVPLGLARTGTAGSHFSGDIFLAFS